MKSVRVKVSEPDRFSPAYVLNWLEHHPDPSLMPHQRLRLEHEAEDVTVYVRTVSADEPVDPDAVWAAAVPVFARLRAEHPGHRVWVPWAGVR